MGNCLNTNSPNVVESAEKETDAANQVRFFATYYMENKHLYISLTVTVFDYFYFLKIYLCDD